METQDIVAQLQERYEDNCRQIADDHWIFEVMTGEGRSQVVHLMYKENILADRDASRFIAESPIGQIRQRYNLEEFLRRNAELDVGAICIREIRDEENLPVPYLTLRATHLAATADIDEMYEMIEMVAHTADETEKEIYARDLH